MRAQLAVEGSIGGRDVLVCEATDKMSDGLMQLLRGGHRSGLRRG